MSGTASVATYVDSDTEVLSASNGVEYAYRVTGASDSPPLVTLQHFRGNLDSWDPALIDALAAGRRVITFDNRGVAATSGRTPSTMAQMALDAIDFIDALDIGEVDLLGFSIGSFLAQEIALIRPASVRKVVLASSAPKGASGMHGWAPAYLHRLDRQWAERGTGVMVRFADDLLVMCKSRREAERALVALTAILAELSMAPKAAKTRIVHLAEGGEGLDFLGFHHRWVRSRDDRFKHVAFLARWPSRQAMQRARDRVRELTGRNRLR
jgi:pimeloyl-ACP methyl ester carboxylesterase